MRTYFLRLLVVLVVATAALALVVFVRMAGLKAAPVPEGEPHPFSFDEDGAPGRLAHALTFRTVSAAPADRDAAPWHGLHEYLARSFPRVHGNLEVEVVGGLSRLYTWRGRDPELPPILLSAHTDVVPVDPESLGEWTHPPFGGVVADGKVWGRGALDMKAPLMAILEAVEGLLADGFVPERTVLLAFGHDEELGGSEGAARIAQLLAERGVRPEWALDEGAAIVSGLLRGLSGPVGLVGTAEKGVVTVRLEARGSGGHAAIPPDPTTVGNLAEALSRLEDRPFPPRIEGPARDFLLAVAPHMDPGTRMLVANLWLLEGPLLSALEADPVTAWLVRTTTAPTVVRGGVRENVLPTRAEGLVNLRLAPWDSTGDVVERIRSELAGLDVEVSVFPDQAAAIPPSRVSSIETRGYRHLAAAIHRVFPDVVTVAPFLVFAATDGRHYDDVAENVYRFAPFRADPGIIEEIHGMDEHIPVRGYLDMIRLYAELLRTSTS